MAMGKKQCQSLWLFSLGSICLVSNVPVNPNSSSMAPVHSVEPYIVHKAQQAHDVLLGMPRIAHKTEIMHDKDTNSDKYALNYASPPLLQANS